MQIIIPMSGFGERFRKAGYDIPKPLILMEGKPIIAHVIDMFPGETDFIFICNQNHLDEDKFRMRAILNEICPTGRVVGISPHKLGPVHAVQQVYESINDHSACVVNYCDFTCYWDFEQFKKMVGETECDGAIPAYRGFHPHSLGSTNYAYMREQDNRVLDIKEKEPFTDNRMNEYASSGTYYFKSGRVLKSCFDACVAEDLSLNGEFYVSLAYKPLLASNANIQIFELPHFMQWGTPEDVDEYNGWSEVFRNISEHKVPISSEGHAVIIPMAGLGQRFADEGYTLTKPLIPVKNQPMVLSAVDDLPIAEHHVFVLRADMPDVESIKSTIRSKYPSAIFEVLPEVSQGQAITCLAGLDALNREHTNFDGVVTFAACDNGAIYDGSRFLDWIHNEASDVLVWGARGHANAIRHPEMFGWIEEANGEISAVSVKKPLSNPRKDPIITGTVSFRSGAVFRRALESLVERDGRVNGEFYLDSCVNDALSLGMKCSFFENNQFISWGTPNDLKTFEYWASCFTKWNGHPFNGF
jgi:NDP-sugar pyrophosphorylase family protein